MSFGEEDLASPVNVSRTSDKCQPTRLDIRGDEQIVRIEYKNGTGTGAGFAEHSKGNVTVTNLPPDEEGNPQPQEWDILIAGEEIATWCRAQPAAVSNGLVLKKLATFILGEKGVI